MKSRKGSGEGFMLSFLMLFLVLVGVSGAQWYAEEFNALGNVDCMDSEIEIYQKPFGSYCLDYQQHKDVVIQKLRAFDKPVSDDQIADVITYLEEDEVRAILERYRKEQGNIYNSYDNGIKRWEYLEGGDDK